MRTAKICALKAKLSANIEFVKNGATAAHRVKSTYAKYAIQSHILHEFIGSPCFPIE